MTDLRHPSDETLLRLASGSLGLGPSAVVGAHVAGCARCGGVVEDFERVAGALLELLPDADVPADGLARALAAIERDAPRSREAPPAPPPSRVEMPKGVALPQSVGDCDFSPWRTIAPGIRVSRARAHWARAFNVKLLSVQPGKRLLMHGHRGVEWTCVLAGAFHDGRARFAAGDLCEVDESVDHRPVVEPGEACVCLVAAEGSTRHHGMAGRLHQAIFGD